MLTSGSVNLVHNHPSAPGQTPGHIVSRQSLPHFSLSKPVRRLNHRQSAPGPFADHEEDIFENKFLVLEALGKGAFSQVVKVKEKESGAVYAVKKARGVFEGVKDRLVELL